MNEIPSPFQLQVTCQYQVKQISQTVMRFLEFQ